MTGRGHGCGPSMSSKRRGRRDDRLGATPFSSMLRMSCTVMPACRSARRSSGSKLRIPIMQMSEAATGTGTGGKYRSKPG